MSNDREIPVLDWDSYFMGFAHLASVRSPDLQTKVGCVIVNSDNHILGVGYNGFPAGTNDKDLPRVRPGKYAYIVHSEMNAISNMLMKQKNLRAYITARPCLNCLKAMWQNGIRDVIIDPDGVIHSMTEEDMSVAAFLIENGLKLRECKFNKEIFKVLCKI